MKEMETEIDKEIVAFASGLFDLNISAVDYALHIAKYGIMDPRQAQIIGVLAYFQSGASL